MSDTVSHFDALDFRPVEMEVVMGGETTRWP